VGCARCMEEMTSAYKILVIKPERKSQVGKLRRRWDNSLKLDLTQIL
jgi:hypothetical protein